MTVTELHAALADAIKRGIDPDTAVVVDTQREATGGWYRLVDSFEDPTLSDDYIWFTLNTGDDCDSRFTPGHYPE